jgi:hypothetical protein
MDIRRSIGGKWMRMITRRGERRVITAGGTSSGSTKRKTGENSKIAVTLGRNRQRCVELLAACFSLSTLYKSERLWVVLVTVGQQVTIRRGFQSCQAEQFKSVTLSATWPVACGLLCSVAPCGYAIHLTPTWIEVVRGKASVRNSDRILCSRLYQAVYKGKVVRLPLM